MGQVLSIDQADYPVPAGAALQENADWTLGPLFVGWAGNVFLCGIVVSWAASYWPRAKGDKPLVKLAVVVAVLFECLTAIANLWVRPCRRLVREELAKTDLLKPRSQSLVDHGKDQDRTNDAISLLIGPDALSVTLGTVVAAAVQSFFATRCVRVRPFSSSPHSLTLADAPPPCRSYRTDGGCPSSSGPGASSSRRSAAQSASRRSSVRRARASPPLSLSRSSLTLCLPTLAVINKGATDVTRGASPDAYKNLFDLALAWLFCGMAADVSISCVLLSLRPYTSSL